LAELRRISDGSLIRSFTEHPGTDTVVKFTPDGQKIVTAGWESAIRFWNVGDGSLAQIYDEEMTTGDGRINVPEISFSPDGSKFAYSRGDATLVVANNPFNQSARRTKFDFDGDSKTDISIFRPNVGEWWYLRSSDLDNRALQFGQSTDIPVPADFTGDGKTDIAFWRNGEWFVLRSEDDSFFSFPFGTSGDIPAPGDFDGDGKADPTVFRPSEGVWYVSKTTGGTDIIPFGIAEDKPVVADYDGDGKDDIGIFRPSVSQWWINRSTDGLAVVQFGSAGDKTVPGDYTGDGKADIAFFRPTSGEWFIVRSENNSFFSFPFGTNGDIAAPGDYDGDGTFDSAVFRPSQTTWYLNTTSSGVQIVGFGANGDIPVPSVFSVP
jgi:WD40 repeat protein